MLYMAKLSRITNQSGKFLGYLLFCPGCQCGHVFYTQPWNYGDRPGPVWKFNNNLENPTFSPSLLINKSTPERRCHSFVRDGQWQFLGDCYHNLAGKTVDLVDLEATDY